MIDLKGTIKAKVKTPLLCWDIYALSLVGNGDEAKKRTLEKLTEYQVKFDWQIDFKEVLRSPYDALVLTDHMTRIKWVDDGFYKMTGYRKKEVLNKSPKILQGPRTTAESREQIREKLYSGKPFTSRLVNYRKNGEEYICGIEVYPLFDKHHKLCHFLALESEVR